MKLLKLSFIALCVAIFCGCAQTANGGLSLTGKTYSNQE